MPRLLIEIAHEVSAIYRTVSAEDPDLFGYSLLDLMADKLPKVSLGDLKTAIVVSGIYARANTRIREQIRRMP